MTHADLVETLMEWAFAAPWWRSLEDRWQACSLLVDLASDRRCWGEA